MGTKRNVLYMYNFLRAMYNSDKIEFPKVPEGYVIVPISLPVLVSVPICGMKICSDQNEI